MGKSLDNKIINGAKQILNEDPELNLSEVVKFENVLGMLKERLVTLAQYPIF